MENGPKFNMKFASNSTLAIYIKEAIEVHTQIHTICLLACSAVVCVVLSREMCTYANVSHHWSMVIMYLILFIYLENTNHLYLLDSNNLSLPKLQYKHMHITYLTRVLYFSLSKIKTYQKNRWFNLWRL